MKQMDHKIRDVLMSAVNELGLDEAYLIALLRFRESMALSKNGGRILYGKLSAADWVWLAEILFIPLDVEWDSWSRMAQCHQVGAAIMEGRFILPMNDKVRSMLSRFIANERKGIRFNKEHYGSPLLERVILGRRETIKERRLIRMRNRTLYLEHQRRHKHLRSSGRQRQPNAVFSFGLRFSTSRVKVTEQTESFQ